MPDGRGLDQMIEFVTDARITDEHDRQAARRPSLASWAGAGGSRRRGTGGGRPHRRRHGSPAMVGTLGSSREPRLYRLPARADAHNEIRWLRRQHQ
jgi:hypothetical protein